MPPLARAAGLLALLGAVPLTLLTLRLAPPAGGGWVLFLVWPLLQVTGGVLLLAGRSRLFLVLATVPGLALMALLFLVSGPDLEAMLGSVVQAAICATTLCLALHPDARDWIADQAARPPGGRRGPAPSR